MIVYPRISLPNAGAPLDRRETMTMRLDLGGGRLASLNQQ